MLLAGDIGATNIRLALFENSQSKKIIKECKYLSNNFTSIISVIKDFLNTENFKIEIVSFGVAGPVEDKKCSTTNLAWVIDIEEIAKFLKISKAYLINDLEACAYSIDSLNEKDFFVLNEGKINDKKNACILAAGTGLGEAGLFFDGEKLRPFACEGGHTDFAPKDDLEIDLLKFLMKKYDHVSWERILSGSGIYDLYQFLIQTKKEPLIEELDNELQNYFQPQILITQKGINNENKLCHRILNLFSSLYGAEAGNLALKLLALGGVYVGGGIAPRIIDCLKNGSFMSSFVKKGRFSNMMMTMPVKVIMNESATLIGAKNYAYLKK